MSWPRPMCGSWLYCIAALCGSEYPAARHAANVNPEQSYPPGPSAAHTYGVPSAPYAYRTATPALPDTAGARTLGCDVLSWLDPYACRRSAAQDRADLREVAALVGAHRDRGDPLLGGVELLLQRLHAGGEVGRLGLGLLEILAGLVVLLDDLLQAGRLGRDLVLDVIDG